MGILSNIEIEKAIKSGSLIINPAPLPNPGQPDSPYDTCSVQLRLDDSLLIPKKGLRLTFDLSQPGTIVDTLESICERVSLENTGYKLKPGEFVLAQTMEEVGFPKKTSVQLAGRIEGRSSFARTGLLVHFTAPTLHAGWQGRITLELLNQGPLPMTLTSGLSICQLLVETVEGNTIPSTSQQFNRQKWPTGSTAVGGSF